MISLKNKSIMLGQEKPLEYVEERNDADTTANEKLL